jgi:hypothetical protein
MFVTLKMEAILFSETAGLVRTTRKHIPEDVFFLVTAVKASDLTQFMMYFAKVSFIPPIKRTLFKSH